MEEKTDYIGDLNDDEISEVLDKAMSEEDNLWDEVIEKYSQTHYEDGGLMLLDWLKQHYSLIKKK